MAENKMAEVAQIFSKKLNEPFVVYVPFHKCKNEAMFDAHGFRIKTYGEWHYDSDYLIWLLTGDAKIVGEMSMNHEVCRVYRTRKTKEE